MPSMLELGEQILAAQPFSALLQSRLTVFAEGTAELVIPLRPQLLQQHGFVHGGVLSYAADNALTFAGGSVLGPAVVTSEYKINYVKPAQGETLIARASVIASGKRQAVCRCDLFVDDGERETLCATALGTIARLSSSSGAAQESAANSGDQDG
ncbi:MAG TPA: PaaI family thioesterase [Herpetosiphonaceae bacterium]